MSPGAVQRMGKVKLATFTLSGADQARYARFRENVLGCVARLLRVRRGDGGANRGVEREAFQDLEECYGELAHFERTHAEATTGKK